MEGDSKRGFARGSVAAAALARRTPAFPAGYGDAARGCVTVAAEAWLPPECLASHGNGTGGSVAAALAWLQPTCIAGHGDVTRRSVAVTALAGLPPTCLAGYGDVTRESVAAAALARLPPACVAGYGGDVSVTAAALEWLPPACLAGYGDMYNKRKTCNCWAGGLVLGVCLVFGAALEGRVPLGQHFLKAQKLPVAFYSCILITKYYPFSRKLKYILHFWVAIFLFTMSCCGMSSFLLYTL